MNNQVSKIIASLAFLAATASFAGAEGPSKEAVELPAYTVTGISSMPSLIKQSNIPVSAKLVGTQVALKFTINKKGKPVGISSAKPLHGIHPPRSRDFAVLMIETLKHWRFKPATSANGEAKDLKVLMPIRVTERDDKAIVQASLKPLSAD